jgi:hypothetical protein
MATKKFNQLTEQTAPADADIIAIQENGTGLNKKTKFSSLKTLFDNFFVSVSSQVGTALDALTTSVLSLNNTKANRAASPTNGNVAGVDTEGDVTDLGVVGTNLVTAAAAFEDDKVILGAGANKTLKKSTIAVSTIYTTGKITVSTNDSSGTPADKDIWFKV